MSLTSSPQPLAPVLAIDGPSASGKGTVAQRVARELGFHYLDSGALYRIVALASERAGMDWQDGAALARLAATLDIRFEDDDILVNGENVSAAVRSEAMGKGASEVAVHQALRSQLLTLQHAFRREPGLVADGRDMGSVVFADAQTKVFLTAGCAVRAERRYKQLIEKGNHASLPHVLADIEERDARDKARTSAPLIQCDEALFLDTSQLTIDEAVAAVLRHYQNQSSRQLFP
jgi:cytidylate kinase